MSNQSNRYQGTKCPFCTSILTKQDRAEALKKNVGPLVKTEDERNRLYMIVWGILRERGGEIVLRRPPEAEEMAGHTIGYKIDDDGALRISLPNTVIVESGTGIIAG